MSKRNRLARSFFAFAFYLVAVGAIDERADVQSGWTSWALLVIAAAALWSGTATLTGHLPVRKGKL